ncbi:carbamoyl phosphate synthase large subunit [Bacillus sp. FJAT-45037]|uniref:carbamoyl phosphate synthase large subunit n=1 Tax=Bacillus sp. FJAT-45037 TaxID=2011007 RepID=UPI000C23D566|nr:carbamoyl phosphate synthase large subunit [Bacillus sp. FJAT-45037]
MPKHEHIQSVLVIGSGPIVIGQAAEFDYAGTQACLALKEEGIKVILVNNNPATVMTDESCADVVYFEPLTVESVERIIKKEQPDGLLATLGGQTGLNLALALNDQGILAACGVELLGTPIESIKKGEDREAFRALMNELAEPVPDSDIVQTIDGAVQFAEKVGYPIIVRPAYTLGGAGGGIAETKTELMTIVKGGLAQSPISQCLIEKSIAGFKEIEYEVMRDENDTCITICNMENIDPVGIHTGDSIVVAPSQTLTDVEYQMLRSVSIKIIRALGIVGGCNIQFALDPKSKTYYLIEVNPRVSRSSALASKATGYPIARIAAKLSMGYLLHELINPVTGHTYASFEPALDYVVVKFPRWPFDKLVHADRTLGTQMKATGEVMAIERNIEAAIQKAVRSLEIKVDGLRLLSLEGWRETELWDLVVRADDRRFFAIMELMRRGTALKLIHDQTQINQYFLHAFHKLVTLEQEITSERLNSVTIEKLTTYKVYGFQDHWLAKEWNVSENLVKDKRIQLGILPRYKMVDTCAGEFTAATSYYYSSWSGESDVEVSTDKKKIVILGSGPIRIGQGIEFDYCSVHGAISLHKLGYEAIIINNNPETVSTDYATADRLYFEPLTVEDVVNIIELEQPEGVVVGLGGQTAISLVKGLEQAGIHIFGTSTETIDLLEDRGQFYQFMNEIEVPHIPGVTVMNIEEAQQKALDIGFPVLIRPSYVIGGQGMVVANSTEELSELFELTHHLTFPLLIDAYYPGVELEVDVLTDGENVYIAGLFEQIEKAGVHSGDSLAVTPPYSISDQIKKQVLYYTEKMARGMDLRGLFNVQFVFYKEELYVIEVNPRASRTVPILSKINGEPLIDYTVRLLLGQSLPALIGKTGYAPTPSFYTVKAPVFSYQKLPGVDPILEAEMKSTGELISISSSIAEAFSKAFASVDQRFTSSNTSAGTVYLDIDSTYHTACIPYKKQLVDAGFQVVENDFDTWVETADAALLVSIPKRGFKNGKKKRIEALKQRITVMTELTTLEAMLKGKQCTTNQLLSIEEWRKQAKLLV